jgi:RNA polymerase subunit RPABC4/transcription elongation factor Spt4
MNEKSFVSMERKICPVCCTEFSSGAILLDRRLRDSMEKNTITGMDMCPTHRQQTDEGYIHLVEVDPEKSSGNTPDTVWRTGRLAAVKRELASQMFDFDITTHPICFCEPAVISQLEELAQEKDNG